MGHVKVPIRGRLNLDNEMRYIILLNDGYALYLRSETVAVLKRMNKVLAWAARQVN